MSLQHSIVTKTENFVKDYPYTAYALAFGAGLGVSHLVRTYQFRRGWPPRLERIAGRGVVKDGMRKEAIGE